MSLVFRSVILDEDDIRLLDHARDLAAAGSRHGRGRRIVNGRGEIDQARLVPPDRSRQGVGHDGTMPEMRPGAHVQRFLKAVDHCPACDEELFQPAPTIPLLPRDPPGGPHRDSFGAAGRGRLRASDVAAVSGLGAADHRPCAWPSSASQGRNRRHPVVCPHARL
jgi:hypothetical protein